MNENDRRELWNHAATCLVCGETAENYNQLAMAGKADEGEVYLKEIKTHMLNERTEKALDELHEQLTGRPRRKEKEPATVTPESPFFDGGNHTLVSDVEYMVHDIAKAYNEALALEEEMLKLKEKYSEAVKRFKALRANFFELNIDDFDREV